MAAAVQARLPRARRGGGARPDLHPELCCARQVVMLLHRILALSSHSKEILHKIETEKKFVLLSKRGVSEDQKDKPLPTKNSFGHYR